jgi:5-formyltetrahydrofolate cyclo-ligase
MVLFNLSPPRRWIKIAFRANKDQAVHKELFSLHFSTESNEVAMAFSMKPELSLLENSSIILNS